MSQRRTQPIAIPVFEIENESLLPVQFDGWWEIDDDVSTTWKMPVKFD